MVTLYTDGSSLGNPGPGGYGAILSASVKGKYHEKEFSGGFRKTTNNRMELLAVIVGLESLTRTGVDVRVYSDSKYVVDAVQKGWLFNWEKKNFAKAKNPDLWQRFLKIYRQHNVQFQWVKGHAGIDQNERCDRLAVEAAEAHPKDIDVGFEAVNG
ncbi:MAG: ribonuclease HI [Bacteroidota bacterium]